MNCPTQHTISLEITSDSQFLIDQCNQQLSQLSGGNFYSTSNYSELPRINDLQNQEPSEINDQFPMHCHKSIPITQQNDQLTNATQTSTNYSQKDLQLAAHRRSLKKRNLTEMNLLNVAKNNPPQQQQQYINHQVSECQARLSQNIKQEKKSKENCYFIKQDTNALREMDSNEMCKRFDNAECSRFSSYLPQKSFVIDNSSSKKGERNVEEKWKTEKQRLLAELDVTRKNYQQLMCDFEDKIKEKQVIIIDLNETIQTLKQQIEIQRNQQQIQQPIKQENLNLKENDLQGKETIKRCSSFNLLQGKTLRLSDPSTTYRNQRQFNGQSLPVDISDNQSIIQFLMQVLNVESPALIFSRISEYQHQLNINNKFLNSLNSLKSQCKPQIDPKETTLKDAWKFIKGIIQENILCRKEIKLYEEFQANSTQNSQNEIIKTIAAVIDNDIAKIPPGLEKNSKFAELKQRLFEMNNQCPKQIQNGRNKYNGTQRSYFDYQN